MTQKKYDIFISYRRDGGIDSAVALQSTLRQMHYRVFLDVDGLHAGRFDEALLKHIDECKDFLLILSPHALDRCVNEDDWVRQEIEYAMSSGKNIIPIICDGGSVQERLNVELPESLADLTRYQVLQTNVMQLQAMTQLLRTTLTAKPHNSRKGIVAAALVAALMCVIGFLAASAMWGGPRSFPRTEAEKYMVKQVIKQQYNNLTCFNTAQHVFWDALDDCSLYFRNSSWMPRENVSLSLEYALNTIEAQQQLLTDVETDLIQAVSSSPFSASELSAQDDFLRLCMNDLYSTLLFLDTWLLDTPKVTPQTKEAWTSARRQIVEINGQLVLAGVNEAFLPLTDDALATLRYTYLPTLSDIYHGLAWWYSTPAELHQLTDDLFLRYENTLETLLQLSQQNEELLDFEQFFTEQFESAIKQNTLPAFRETLSRLQSQSVELADKKRELYTVHRPLVDDPADILFAKGLMFLSFNMSDAAVECFRAYSMSDDPNAGTVSNTLIRFSQTREITGISSGVIVCEYEAGKPPQPDVKPGDIIYAVNGIEVAYFDDYASAKNGNAASTVHILRFTGDNYEKLTVQLAPDAGLLGLRSLEYE